MRDRFIFCLSISITGSPTLFVSAMNTGSAPSIFALVLPSSLASDLTIVGYDVPSLNRFVSSTLYAALRRATEAYRALATILAFVGIADYFASNTALSMLSLSNQYAAATTDAQRSLILAAGQAMLAVSQGTGIYVAFIFVSLAGLTISVVMQRSNIFSKVTAYVGILANAFSLADYFRVTFVPAAGAVLLSISGVLLVTRLILIARRLFHLGRGHPSPSPYRSNVL